MESIKSLSPKFKAFLLCLFMVSLMCACMGFSTDTSPQLTDSTSPTSGNISEASCTAQFKLACLSIVRRYKYLNDANKFGYFYEFLPGVNTPIEEIIVQGSVFPVSDLINNTQYQQECNSGGSGACAVVLDKQQPDGTYGTNGADMTVFGWDSSGAYFEWSGVYKYSQVAINYPNKPQIVIVGCSKHLGIPDCQ